MKLNHLSSNISLEPYDFTPGIPENRMEGENEDYFRICFSSSVENCCKAIPDSMEGISYRKDNELTTGVPALFSVFEIETDDFNELSIIPPEILKQEALVPDAIETQEYWITEDIKQIKPSYLIWIREIQYGNSQEDEDFFKAITYEKSIEDYERFFNLSFIYEAEYKSILEWINHSNCQIVTNNAQEGFFDVGEGLYELTIHVPAGEDISELWVKYWENRVHYDSECMGEDFEQLIKYSKPFRE